MTKIKGRCRVGDFDKAFGKLMIKYTTGVEEEIEIMTEKLARGAAKELKEVSAATFKSTQDKPYNKGWTVINDSVRHRSRWIVHNKYKPGLAHLLEHGHAKAGGGRVAGKVHIQPIEEKLVKDYEENVIAIVENWEGLA